LVGCFQLLPLQLSTSINVNDSKFGVFSPKKGFRETSMRPFRSLPLFVLAGTLFCGIAAIAQNAAPARRIVSQIDESQLVTLRGTVHPLATAAHDRGAAPDGMQLERMHLVLKRSASQETALRQLIGDLHTPGTASYHKWLTPDEFGKQFGPSDEDIAAVQTWLASHGFSVSKVNPGKQTIEFSGNVGLMRDAFHTSIHQYQVNGQTHYANASDPKIPAALAPVVGGFVSLNNFQVKSHLKQLGEASYDPKTDKAKPQWTIGPSGAAINDNFVLSPADYAVQYDLNPLYSAGITGAGQTIAIINESNINVARVNSFRSIFGLPANPPQVIIDGNDPGVDGINNPDGPNDASVEAYLDVEWAGAVAPNATVDLVIGADTTLESGLVLAAEHAVYGNVAPIMSISFGNCESALGSGNQFLSNLWEQAAAQGITVLVSTGDSGSAGCDNENSVEYASDGQQVSGWASTPFNVAVGGTDFYYSSFSQGQSAVDAQLATYWNTALSNNTPTASILGHIPEQPWNNSQYGLDLFDQYSASDSTPSSNIVGGSGGASNCALATYTSSGATATCTGGYPKPAWQVGTGVPADGVRDIPDVSLFAANGFNDSYYPICAIDGDCQPVSSSGTLQIYGVGGTSASTPSFAGIMALVNQKYGPQGQADFVLYPLAKQFPKAFNDVTVGTNTVPCAVGSLNCIAVSNPATVVVTDSNGNSVSVQEGEIGAGTTAEYNAGVGYDLATGLGTVDANQLVTNWGSVKFASTTTTLTPSSTSFTHGTPISVSGTVTVANGTASGDVALMTSSPEPLQQGQTFFTLSNGSYSGPNINYLPGGTYNIWGQYGGDGTNGMSSSTPVSITVNPESSGVAFYVRAYDGTPTTAPGTSVDYGTQMNLSAMVAPSSQLAAEQSCITGTAACPAYGTPTGTVTFLDGSTTLNTVVINAEGDAEYNAPFAVGAHTVSASYSGDQSYNKSTSAAAIPFTVVQDTPVVVLNTSVIDGSNNDLINGPGQPTVLTVQIENGAQANSPASSGAPVAVAPPTGSVTLTSTLTGFSGTATLTTAVDPTDLAVEGVATFVVPAGTISGNYTVGVAYSGDTNYKAISNTNYSIPIETTNNDGGLNSVTAATLSGSISPNTTVTLTGTVTGQSGKAAPTGQVYVYSSGNSSVAASLSTGSSDISNFSITLNSQSLFLGANYITVQYLGDNNYNPSAVVLNNPVLNSLADFTLTPDTTVLPVTAGGSATTGINVASAIGFSGNVSLTCTAAPGITCTLPSSATLTSGSSTSATLTVNASAFAANTSYNVLITGTDPTGEYVHTLGVQVVVTGSQAGSQSFALSSSGNLSLDAGINSNNTSTITVTPLGSFNGTVNLSCAVSGPSGATSPATCSLASATVASGSGTDVLTISTTSTTTAGVYAVTVTGTGTNKAGTAITQTTLVNANVNLPSFSFGTPAPSITIGTVGSSGTAALSISSKNGFTGSVTLSCSITPVAATDAPTCSVPATVNVVAASPAAITLTVNTTGATSSLNQPARLFGPYAGGAALAILLFFSVPRRRRNWLLMFGLLAIFVSAAAIGCGGGGGNSGGGGGGGGGSTGTPTGNYTVTVTAVSGTITQTTTVALTIN